MLQPQGLIDLKSQLLPAQMVTQMITLFDGYPIYPSKEELFKILYLILGVLPYIHRD